eukprot:1788539-Prymnesium_polylepis.1
MVRGLRNLSVSARPKLRSCRPPVPAGARSDLGFGRHQEDATHTKVMKYTTVFAGLATVHAILEGQPIARPALQRAAVLRGGNIIAQAPAALALPQDGFDGAVAAGVKKANMPAGKIFKLGVLSGCHIGFGAFLMLSVGG